MIDFSGLEKLARNRQQDQPEEPAPIKPNDPIKRHQEEETERRRVYKQQVKNIISSNAQRVEIIKAAQAGDDPGHLLLMALDCITTMTGDEAFKTAVIEAMEQHKA